MFTGLSKWRILITRVSQGRGRRNLLSPAKRETANINTEHSPRWLKNLLSKVSSMKMIKKARFLPIHNRKFSRRQKRIREKLRRLWILTPSHQQTLTVNRLVTSHKGKKAWPEADLRNLIKYNTRLLKISKITSWARYLGGTTGKS